MCRENLETNVAVNVKLEALTASNDLRFRYFVRLLFEGVFNIVITKFEFYDTFPSQWQSSSTYHWWVGRELMASVMASAVVSALAWVMA